MTGRQRRLAALRAVGPAVWLGVIPAFLMAPVALLPAGVGDWVVTALLLLVAPACLRLCGVRDLRCYGAVFLWAPVVWSVQTGNLSLPLALGAVLLWRYRDRVVVAAAIAAAMIAVKLFLWPVVVWLAGSILASPIVWLHYLALLLVPVALSRPRFGWIWLAPALLWICPVRPAAPTWLTLLVLAVGGA